MSKRIGGFRRKSRDKLRKSPRTRGKISIRKYLQTFNNGDIVCLKMDSAFHKGVFFPRFQGKTGIVSGKQGRCYQISFRDGNKEKMLIVHPLHLIRMKGEENGRDRNN